MLPAQPFAEGANEESPLLQKSHHQSFSFRLQRRNLSPQLTKSQNSIQEVTEKDVPPQVQPDQSGTWNFWKAFASVFVSAEERQSRQELDERLAMQQGELARVTAAYLRSSSEVQASWKQLRTNTLAHLNDWKLSLLSTQM